MKLSIKSGLLHKINLSIYLSIKDNFNIFCVSIKTIHKTIFPVIKEN